MPAEYDQNLMDTVNTLAGGPVPTRAGSSSSLADRLARQYEQQFGRPADASDPHYAAYIQTALPKMIADDRAAYEASKRRWGVADKVAMGTTLGLLGMGVGSAIGAAGGAGGAGGGSASAAGGALPAIEGGAPWAVTPYATTATMSAPGAIGAGAGTGVGGAVGAGAGTKALAGGMSAKDWAALALAVPSVVGPAVSGNNQNYSPNTQTTDPNLVKLMQTMQGRLDQSEPLYKSIMAMANGLLPTQYQNGGAGR